MQKRFLASAAALAALSMSVASAQQLNETTRQQLHDQTYRQLGNPGGPGPETVFSRTYTQTVGAQPDFDEFLIWKYLSDYPDSRTGTAAVRQMPTTTPAGTQTMPMTTFPAGSQTMQTVPPATSNQGMPMHPHMGQQGMVKQGKQCPPAW